MFEDPLWPDVQDVLRRHKKIAVVGLSNRPYRDSFRVSRYMLSAGYRIVPVNPMIDEVFGLKSYSDLLSVPEDVEIVNVFRRSEYLPEIVDQAIQKKARCVWTQFGVVHEEAAEAARQAGLTVILDRCIMVEHQRLGR